jgi:hypothetical protein
MTLYVADDPRHGTIGGYANHKCRCARCVEAIRAYNVALHAYRAEHPLDPDDPRHGRFSTYVHWRCRCMPCTVAARHYYAARRSAA